MRFSRSGLSMSKSGISGAGGSSVPGAAAASASASAAGPSSIKSSKPNPTNALDEVIKRRLLIDGDGVGDDRKIHNLLKSILSWASSDEKTDDETGTYRRLLHQIRQIEYSVRRTYGTLQTTKMTRKLYTQLQAEIDSEIRKTEQIIESSKSELEEETKHRKHSMEYEALSKLIETKPDRRATEVKQGGLEDDVESLTTLHETLNEKLVERQKSVDSLSFAIQSLRDLVAQDEKECEELNSETYQNIIPVPVDSTERNVEPRGISSAAAIREKREQRIKDKGSSSSSSYHQASPAAAAAAASTSASTTPIRSSNLKSETPSSPTELILNSSIGSIEQMDTSGGLGGSASDDFLMISSSSMPGSPADPIASASGGSDMMLPPPLLLQPPPPRGAPISPEPLLDDSIDEGEILDGKKDGKYEDLSEESPEEGESED